MFTLARRLRITPDLRTCSCQLASGMGFAVVGRRAQLCLSWSKKLCPTPRFVNYARTSAQSDRGFADAVSVDKTTSSVRQTATQRRRWPKGIDGAPVRTATAKRLGISTSPQKLNLVARLIRGLSVEEAQRQLAGTLKKHRLEVSNAIRTAVSNARSFGMLESRLIISQAYVNKGKYLKRLRPWHGKGRFGIEHKKYAHLCLEVQELSEEDWEAKVSSQYVHMRFRPNVERLRKIPPDLVRPWSVRSQLDMSLEETQRRCSALASLLPRKKHPFPAKWKADVTAL